MHGPGGVSGRLGPVSRPRRQPGPGHRPRWAALAEAQHGAVSRRQLIRLGLSRDQVRWLVASGRFQPLLHGVYAAFTGPVPWRTRLAAALLYAGPGAVIGGRTALRLHGVLDPPPEDRPDAEPVEVCIPHPRRVVATDGLLVRAQRRVEDRAQQLPWPPRLRVEEAVLDVAGQAADDERAIAVLLAAVQRRRTTPQRIRAALEGRARQPRRALVLEVLAEASEGVHSLLERRYLRDVERAHGLPAADRQHRAGQDGTGARYRDLRYRRERVVVELDGEIAHPEDARQRDAARNRGIVADGDVPLGYGWAEVAATPCATAAEVAAVLQARGWPGTPHGCGRPGCPFPPRST